jgi:hypothetical protein
MKKKIRSALFFVIFVLCAGFFFGQQDIEREYVQVLNIEMLVRVMKDGRPLAGLQKGDFFLFENGQKQEINGFLEVHRRITPDETGEKVKPMKEERPGRLFLLFFWINEPVVKVDEVLDYFFKSIYHEGDRVILADQRHSLEINSTAEKEAKVEEFKSGLAALSRDLRFAREKFKLDIDSYLQDYVSAIMAKKKPREPLVTGIDAQTLVARYAQLLKEYRLQNQTPNADRLEAMSRSLEAIDADKWALVFFQHDSLPLFDTEKLKLEDYQLGLGPAINEIEKVNRDLLFPVEARRLADSLRTRFIQANTQFHLLLLGSRQAPAAADATSGFAVVNPFPVVSNWEETFRQMTAATGGKIMDGNRMKEALAEVANREDVYYVLTYAPTVGRNRERRIDIQVGRKGVRVIHGRRLEMENLPGIKLAAIVPAPGEVRLDLENVYMFDRGGLHSGLVRVSLFAAREGEKAQALAQDLEIETSGSVEIPTGQLPPGKYRLAAQVVDCLTGVQAQGESTLDVLGGEMPVETSALLHLAAAYSERLRQAAFRFICQETVSEDVLVRDPGDRSYKRARNSWLYEYQVVVRAGQVSESRVLLRKNKTKKRVENAALETRFRSLYSVFLPATLFAAEKQPAFFYRLEKHEKMNGRQAARLAIAPRPGFEELGAGTAWVDEETGAVLKIELSQRAIKGIEAVEKRAQRSGARLLVSDVHYYEIERGGIWLPSRTSISEYYVLNVVPVWESHDRWIREEARETPPPAKYASSSGGNRQLELSRTWVEYSDFRFFVVDVQTQEEQ